MIAKDTATLKDLFADEMSYTYSDALVDRKASYLKAIDDRLHVESPGRRRLGSDPGTGQERGERVPLGIRELRMDNSDVGRKGRGCHAAPPKVEPRPGETGADRAPPV